MSCRNSVRYSVDDRVSEHLKLRVGSEKLAEHLGRYGSVRGLSAQSWSFYIGLQTYRLLAGEDLPTLCSGPAGPKRIMRSDSFSCRVAHLSFVLIDAPW